MMPDYYSGLSTQALHVCITNMAGKFAMGESTSSTVACLIMLTEDVRARLSALTPETSGREDVRRLARRLVRLLTLAEFHSEAFSLVTTIERGPQWPEDQT